eukprot:4590409-Prymnesium_polylepis.1
MRVTRVCVALRVSALRAWLGLLSCAFASGLRVRCCAACRVRFWACCVGAGSRKERQPGYLTVLSSTRTSCQRHRRAA